MAELSTTQRAELAANLVSQAPPGEVNDVINAIRAIVADDEALMPAIAPTLKAYNLANLTVVEHPASREIPAHTSILSEAATLPGSEGKRYIDAVGKQSFAFDHINMSASDYEPYELPEEEEEFRSELAKSLTAYTKNHYSTGQSSVNCNQHPLLPPEPPTPEPEPERAPQAEAPPVAAATAAVDGTDAGGEQRKPDSADPTAPVAAQDEPVTDVISEQVGAGNAEPAPTPAVGAADGKKEEVDEPGGLEKLDEAVEEVKEEEEESAEAKGSVVAKGDVGEDAVAQTNEKADEDVSGAQEAEPVVTEEDGQIEAKNIAPDGTPNAATAATPVTSKPAKAERKQERIENPTYTLEVVGNRYKVDAFWTGRWRSQWSVDKAAGTVSGTIQVDVHYFEQGNVQLATKHEAKFAYPAEVSGQSIPSQIVTAISKVETAYQLEMQDVYGDLGDKAFRALRRALPVTRQKVDWEKVSGYSLGSDISKARA